MITKITKITIPKLLLLFIFFTFAFIRSDCSKILSGTPTDVTGTWELVKMEGNLQDVCLQDRAQFENGNATLQCPGQTPISRTYTYQNGVLTYSTGISYNVSFFMENNIQKMQLQAKR